MGQDMNAIMSELETMKKEGCNILIPSLNLDGLTEFHKAILEKVSLSEKNKDFYSATGKSGGDVRLSKNGLMKLATCAGFIWEAPERIDDGKNRDYARYRVIGGVMEPNGMIRRKYADKDIDLLVEEEQLSLEYSIKTPPEWIKMPTEQWREYEVKKAVLNKRKFKASLCETGAKCRVIRDMLGTKSQYTQQEAGKPFVVMRIVISLDYTNPRIKMLVEETMVRSISGIYGAAPRAQHALPLPQIAHATEVSECEFEDVGDEDTPIEIENIDINSLPKSPPSPKHDKPTVTGPPPQTGKSVQEQEIDFSNCDQDEQLKILEKLIDRKAYDTSKFPKPMAEFSETNRISLFKKLISMPDSDGNLGF